MSTQIAFTLPQKEKKAALQKRLAHDGLTTKSFFNFCIDAYLNRQMCFGIVTDPDRVHESEEDYQAYVSSFDNDEETYTLDDVKKIYQGK